MPGVEQDLFLFVASQGYVNEPGPPWRHNDNQSVTLSGESELERAIHRQRVLTISRILGGEAVSVRVTHAGRVRVAELTSALHTSRLREQYDILWDGRHFETDLRIALLDAAPESPLGVAYLDLNGMKAVNDTAGHEAGDVVMRAYFHSVSTAMGDRGDAYRIGGDEVVVLMGGQSLVQASSVIRRACLLLKGETIRHKGAVLPAVSIATGLVLVTSPGDSPAEVKRLADEAMYRAKEFGRGRSPRPSALMVHGEESVRTYE